MSNIIKHLGVIESINDHLIQVKITQTSACSGCHVQSMCLSTDKKERIIEVYSHDDSFVCNEKVWVCGKEHWGLQVIGWAFFAPFLLVLLTLLLLSIYYTEKIAGIGALSVLIPYYIALYFSKNKFKKKFTFTIEKLN